MVSGLIGIMLLAGLVGGPLLWRVRQDRRAERAQTIRAQALAALFRAFGGDSFVAVQVEPPSWWRPGRVVLSAPADWQRLLEPHWGAVAAQVPDDYELVVKPVAAASRATLTESLPLRRAA
jgi:hypothetical protein